jgi:branched-chain amino acid transport system substrate-binding protein
VNDVQTLGLETAQGLIITECFYWDFNDRTRAFTRRVLPRTPDNYPNQAQAGAYSAALHYLKAVAEMGAGPAKVSGRAVAEVMKRMPTDDDVFGAGTVRQDGRKLHDVHLFEVKTPAESRAMGLLQAPRHHPGRRGLPPAGRRRLPAGPPVTARRPMPARRR